MNVFVILLIIAALLLAAYLFMMWPARASAEDKKRFARRCYAHRGLYENDSDHPENTLAAFENAMQNGYGCELDVQFTKDKKLIVFHDNDFVRACGDSRKVWQVDYDELKTMKLFGSQQTAPLFSEVLATVAGRQPLIVEIKAEEINPEWYYEVCEATMKELRGYKGEYCIESFHPYVVRWLRKNAPDVVRGQLVNGARSTPNLNPVLAWLIAVLACNVCGRPHFIAYNEKDRNLALRLAQKLGAMSVMWTVRTPQRCEELEKSEDAIIFEHFLPQKTY